MLKVRNRKVFWTSDSHWCHDNLVRSFRTSFSNTEEHDEYLIEMWNKTVTDNDVIIHLGDVCWKEREVMRICKRLNGEKYLIPGNHDSSGIVTKCLRSGFTVLGLMEEVRVNDVRILASHYPVGYWESGGRRSGMYMLHGHMHGYVGRGVSIADVGVDVHEYRPVLTEDILCL